MNALDVLYPRPWSIKRDRDYATVTDSDGDCVPVLTDIELGWTDTDTGAYHDPDSEWDALEELVRIVNAGVAK